MWRTVSILALAVACHALPAQDTSHSENEIEGFGDCLKKDSTTCLKYKFFSYVDKMMGQRDTFSLTDGVTVVRASDVPPETGAPRSLNPVDKVKHYFETHSLRVEVKGSDVIDTVSSVGRALEDTVSSFTEDNNELSEEGDGEGRAKKKKVAKILGPLMGIMMMKMLAMMPLKIGVIALIAGKALLIGKLALVLSAIIGLKKLLSSSSSQQKHVTYEVVAHPHHSSSHSSSHDYAGASGYGGDSGGYSSGGGGGHSGGGGGGWGRSADAQSLAYSAQMP